MGWVPWVPQGFGGAPPVWVLCGGGGYVYRRPVDTWMFGSLGGSVVPPHCLAPLGVGSGSLGDGTPPRWVGPRPGRLRTAEPGPPPAGRSRSRPLGPQDLEVIERELSRCLRGGDSHGPPGEDPDSGEAPQVLGGMTVGALGGPCVVWGVVGHL